MSELIVKPLSSPNEDGSVLNITPQTAGWEYVGFEIVRLSEGQLLSRETGGREVCLVLLSGRADVSTREEQWRNVGERMNVFEKTPLIPYTCRTMTGMRCGRRLSLSSQYARRPAGAAIRRV